MLVALLVLVVHKVNRTKTVLTSNYHHRCLWRTVGRSTVLYSLVCAVCFAHFARYLLSSCESIEELIVMQKGELLKL
jgi:hypothetical protein